MDPTNPQVMALIQALQGNQGTAGMTPPTAIDQQASLGNQQLPAQQPLPPMYGAMMTPPPAPQGLY